LIGAWMIRGVIIKEATGTRENSSMGIGLGSFVLFCLSL
jgi:hypothetical protein